MPAIRDEEYAAVVDRERPLIQATAYLLTGDPVRAERLVQLVFAQLYGRLPRVQHPRVEALRAWYRPLVDPSSCPGNHRKRVELMDGPPPVRQRRADRGRPWEAQLRPAGCHRLGLLRGIVQRPDR